MKARFGFALVAMVLAASTGCASGGGSGAAAGPGGQAGAGGVRPRDNEHTRAAELYLTQALSAEDSVTEHTRYNQALQSAQAGITADPGNPQSYFQAGQAYVGLNDFLAADSMLTKAEEMYPVYELEAESWRERGWVDAYNMAIVPLNEGNLEEAVRLFEAADAIYDRRPEALLQLGSLYSRLDQPERSAEAYRKAIAILEESREEQLADTATADIWQQHWGIASMGLGQAYMFGEMWQEAADYFGQMLNDDPENVEVLGNLASVLSQLGEADSTRADFYADSVQALYDNLLNRPGLTERDFFNAGVGLYQIENYAKAAEAFRRAADMNPFNRDARLNLAQTYYAAAMWEELIPAARAVLELDPRNGLIWIFLTRALSETQRTEEANAVFQEYEAIGYDIQNISLDAGGDGGATIRGELKNTSLQPGTTVTLRFHFGGTDGREIGTQDIRVQARGPEEVTSFEGEFSSSRQVTGYRYEVIS